MAGNGIQVGSDGKIRIKNNGIVIAGSGDPCCCTPLNPTALIFQLDSMTPCCVERFPANSIFTDPSPFEGNQYSINFGCSLNLWHTGLQRTDYTGSSCTGTPTVNDATLNILNSFNSLWSGRNFNAQSAREVFPAGIDMSFFVGALTISASTQVLSNVQSACNPLGIGQNNNIAATGGTVTYRYLFATATCSGSTTGSFPNTVTLSSYTNAAHSDSVAVTIASVGGSSEWVANRASTASGIFPDSTSTDLSAGPWWLTITSATSGTGNLTLTFDLAANASGSSRSAFLFVNNLRITITQNA
jgi:hypothetical protein